MERAWLSGASATPPDPATVTAGNYPTDGSPGGGVQPTYPGAYVFHMLMEELRALIVDQGLTPDKTVLTQVRDAVRKAANATIQTITLTGAQNDVAVTAARRLLLRCNNASLLTINGFAAGTDGDEIELVSIGAGDVFVAHQNAGSSVANRLINSVTAGATPIAAGVGTALFRYDGATQRWRLVLHNQGAPVDFTPTWSSSGTAVSLGNGSVTGRYYVRGRMVWFSLIFAAGSTTTYGTGTYQWASPLQSKNSADPCGLAFLFTNGTRYAALMEAAGGQGFKVSVNAAGYVAATNPAAWANGDSIKASGEYETT